tara:strand:- start:2281 stop:2769 length:489 start_codon:yes stop_codon:yes gene_type:complete
MLKIINSLTPFFEDCYRRINVREYAKIQNISPPTASTTLKHYQKENLLKKSTFKNYIFFHANQSKEFIDLSRIYWSIKLKPVLDQIETLDPTIILFGSLSKAETTEKSDIDLAIFSPIKSKVPKSLKNREIQAHHYKSIKDIKNKELLNNILNGYILKGRIR